ncbi:hypothetical protein AV540_21970 [Brevibacillus parabrevis]|uniref:hypothetical protein n=1 Tax=Brevibacillus parabrevis TaxID=54914 RepID=UPI0007AB8168|nr:hypothetical protein [Brevibacillus parabrevis]KZE46622.1 hypothetical protein AV540_21970 [Brevibacillus parabrevis]
MKGQAQHTIYSYKLLYRFRWGVIGYLLQLLLIGLSLIGSSMLLQVPAASLVVTLAILPVIPICHLITFRLYAQLRSQKPRTTADMLVSPWWGAGYVLPVPLSVYRASESTVLVGTALLAAGAFVWLSAGYGLTLLSGVVVVSLPRLIALIASFRQPSWSRVKYENRGVAFLKTDG